MTTNLSPREPWIDMPTLMAIQDLPWRARTLVDGLTAGLHRSPLHGFSVEFSEYRPFSPGDDPRTIDWKLYARSDRYYVKKFEDETNRRCYLVVDQSRSMQYGSIAYTKHDYARTLGATLSLHLIRQRDAVGLLTFDASVKEVVTARYRHGQRRRILGLLDRQPSGNRTDLSQPLSEVAQLVSQRSLVLILSDFLVPVESLRIPLGLLRARRHEVVLMRILDPREIDFQLDGPAMVRDAESQREIFVDPNQAKELYRQRFAEHELGLRSLCESSGIAMETLRTDLPMDRALVRFLSKQQRSGAPRSRAEVGTP
ncbi:MAG: DUF58 domain-containing protein [Planctomycetota bacterium]